jgi:hypothetical protein
VPVVDDAHNPAVAQGEDVEDLALQRLASDLGDARATRADRDLVTRACELERVDIAALVEPQRNVSMTSSPPWQTKTSRKPCQVTSGSSSSAALSNSPRRSAPKKSIITISRFSSPMLVTASSSF